MSDNSSRRILPWLLVFLYFSFVYNYGVRLSMLSYTDFPSFYYGARLCFVDKHSPYDEQALTQAADRTEPLRWGEVRKRVYPYLYPPPSLLMFYPLAHLHLGIAKVGLLALSHACLLFTIGVLLVGIIGYRPREVFSELAPVFIVIYLLFSHGIDLTIEMGQINLLVLALLCMTWLGIRRDWPAWAIALPLGIASVFKVYPVLFLIPLIFRRKYLAAALTVAVLLGVCATSWFILPHEFWRDWATNVAPTCGYLRSPLGVFPPTLQGNDGIAGFTARIFLVPKLYMEANRKPLGSALIPNAALGRLVTYLLVGGVVLLTMGVAYVSGRRDHDRLAPGRARRIDLEFSAILVLTFLVAPLAWVHHLAYVAPAAVIAMLPVLRGEGTAPKRALVLITAFILAWPIALAKLPVPRIAVLMLVSLKLYAVLLLLAILLTELYRSSRQRQRSSSTPAIEASNG